MTEPIIYVDQSEILEGKLEPLRAAVADLASFVEEHEPRLIAYRVYFSDDGRRMTVIHIHPDADSLEFHMEEAGDRFPRFAEYLRLLSIDIYGQPTHEAVERLRMKAERLGAGAVRVHELRAGFARMPEGVGYRTPNQPTRIELPTGEVQVRS